LNFFKPAAMTLFSRKLRGDEGAHDIERELNANDTRAETEDVAVVVFA
jgi:hypothetical protein